MSPDGGTHITPNGATNVTHLLWVGRWIEVVKTASGWQFKTGKDAARWLMSE